MAFFKRIFLFMAVNLLVMVTINLVLSLLGVRPYLSANGIDYQSLMVFCLVWGMGGAFISLALSRIMAKFAMGVQVIDVDTRDPELRRLVDTVHRLARDAGLSTMPQVGIYDSPEVNAFATGPTRNRALVAVSTGLMSRMDARQVHGVLGHEIAHVANGDMVTMTLVQGIVNAFVMFLSRVIAFAIAQAMRGDREREGGMSMVTFHVVQFFLEIVLMFFGMIVVAAFSRWREYRADAGGASLAGRDNMVAALKGLLALHPTLEVAEEQGYNGKQQAVSALKISGRKGLFALFMTHPPLEERIARLENRAA